MTQIEESAQIRPAWLYSAEIQEKARAAREECEKLAPRIRSRLAVQYAQMEAAQAMDFTSDAAPMPPKAPRVFGRSQNEMGFNTIPRVKERPGPKADRATKPKPEPIVKEIKKQELKPEKQPSLPERIRVILIAHGPLTNREIAVKLGWHDNGASSNRASVSTNQMLKRGEIEKVGQKGKFVHIYGIAKDWQPKAEKYERKGANLLAAAGWLKENGPATIAEIAVFLQCKHVFAESIANRLCQYGMAHRAGYSEKIVNHKPLLLFASGSAQEKEI